MKKVSISFALARFVFLSCFTLAVLSTVLVINYVLNSAELKQAQLIGRETSTISNSYQLFLHHRMTILTEHAHYPIMIQALMQPETSIGKVQDFMADLTILGKRYQQSLLDFDGNIIFSTLAGKTPNYKGASWLPSLLNNQQKNHVGIQKLNNQYFWCLAIAISYNNMVEGVLTTLIPIKEIDEQEKSSKRRDGLMIEILADSSVLATFGDTLKGNQHTINWQNIPISFRFTFDNSASNKELYNTIIKLSLLILLVLILTTLLAYVFGYHYFVKPLLLLSQATGELDKGSESKLLQENVRIKELSDLFKKFNSMTEKVHHREQDLQLSYDQLSKANEELILSESQLIQSEKMASIGVLAAGVAHEINNPIGFIKSNLDVLDEYLIDIKKYRQEINTLLTTKTLQHNEQAIAKKYDIDFIFNDIPPLLKSSIGGIDRVSEIVQDLKNFARVEEPNKSSTDINEGLTTTLNMARNELKYNCKVQVELGSLPKILAFPSKLNQVFMNLLINAGQSIEDKGEISVKTFQQGTDIVIEVKDNGSGIDPKILSHIFTPFFTSKPVGEGTGLGLSISHEIIKQHDGKIKVTSEVGKGSCFSIYIPITANK
ncbi:MAG: two-component sensor histidine kinase [Colwellia sp.]|nr:two-component sensor histidine kinase [Colwellia sp.]